MAKPDRAFDCTTGTHSLGIGFVFDRVASPSGSRARRYRAGRSPKDLGPRSAQFVRLYTSGNGRQFDTLIPNLFDEGQPNETSLVFRPDETALCLLRRDGNPASAKLGIAQLPYTNWQWKDLGVKIGGPRTIRLPD